MYKKLILIVFFFLLTYLKPVSIYAEPRDEVDFHEVFVRGKILKIIKQGQEHFGPINTYVQRFNVQLIEGKEKGKIVTVERVGDTHISGQSFFVGESVVINIKPDPKGITQYMVYEPYRLSTLWYVLAGFFLFILIIAGKKGIGALFGLVISIGIITYWIIPQILQGQEPLKTCIIGAIVILLTTTYIAHGISIKTTIAVVGTAISLFFAGLLSLLLVYILHIFGLGNEDIYNLQIGTPHPINPQGLLLGSILISTLGALNDITTTQAITMFTFVKEHPAQKLRDLFYKGMIIGKEHIASLINTLILAYAGSSLAVFIFFELNPAHLPWWVILNNETTIAEIIKSIVGSSALILAVPITTFLAAWIAKALQEE